MIWHGIKHLIFFILLLLISSWTVIAIVYTDENIIALLSMYVVTVWLLTEINSK